MNNTGMNNIITFIKRVLQRDIQRPLGRWRIERIESKNPSNIETPIKLAINNHKK